LSKAAGKSSEMRNEDLEAALASLRASITESRAVSVEVPVSVEVFIMLFFVTVKLKLKLKHHMSSFHFHYKEDRRLGYYFMFCTSQSEGLG